MKKLPMNFLLQTAILFMIFLFANPLRANDVSQQQRAQQVEKALKALKSADINDRRNAADELSRLSSDLAGWPDIRSLSTNLIEYLQRWDENSYKAALLLGDIGRNDSVPILRSVLKKADGIKDEMDDRKVIAPRMKEACLKALLKLREPEAQTEIKKMLEGTSPQQRANAIEAISYAGRKDMVKLLVPLLDDDRDAVNIAPSGGSFYLRVCDLAVNTIVDLAKLSVSFSIQRGEKYTPNQIDEVKRLLTHQ